MDLQELREEIYTDFIQEYSHLTQDQISEAILNNLGEDIPLKFQLDEKKYNIFPHNLLNI